MATSQNTWQVGGSLPDVMNHEGEAYETGGEANTTPNVASDTVPVTMYKVPTVGWCSPNEESSKVSVKGGGGKY